MTGIGRISTIAAVCASSIFLAACVQAPEIVGRTPAERQAGWARKLEVTNDTFKGLTTFKGAYVDQDRFNSSHLRAFRRAGQSDVIQLYVLASFEGGWRYYDSAYTEGGVRYPVTKIDTDVTSCRYECTYWETVGVTFTEESLRKATGPQGLVVKVSGRGGEQLVKLPEDYVISFLDSLRVGPKSPR